jgi:hypothetical protein
MRGRQPRLEREVGVAWLCYAAALASTQLIPTSNNRNIEVYTTCPDTGSTSAPYHFELNHYPASRLHAEGSVADPDPGSGIRCLFDPWIRDPGSGMGRKSASGFGIRDPG